MADTPSVDNDMALVSPSLDEEPSTAPPKRSFKRSTGILLTLTGLFIASFVIPLVLSLSVTETMDRAMNDAEFARQEQETMTDSHILRAYNEELIAEIESRLSSRDPDDALVHHVRAELRTAVDDVSGLKRLLALVEEADTPVVPLRDDPHVEKVDIDDPIEFTPVETHEPLSPRMSEDSEESEAWAETSTTTIQTATEASTEEEEDEDTGEGEIAVADVDEPVREEWVPDAHVAVPEGEDLERNPENVGRPTSYEPVVQPENEEPPMENLRNLGELFDL